MVLPELSSHIASCTRYRTVSRPCNGRPAFHLVHSAQLVCLIRPRRCRHRNIVCLVQSLYVILNTIKQIIRSRYISQLTRKIWRKPTSACVTTNIALHFGDIYQVYAAFKLTFSFNLWQEVFLVRSVPHFLWFLRLVALVGCRRGDR